MIAAIVLAAGGSSRMGRPKQLLDLRGLSLLRRTVDAALAADCRPVVVVLGAAADRMRRELDGLEVDAVHNEDWPDGIGGSISCGVASLRSHGERVRAALLLACDQPMISEGVIVRLIEAFDGSENGLVACEYSGTVGIPALFGQAHFRRLSELSGDRGAKSLLLEDPERVVRVPWPEGAADIDTPADYERLDNGHDVGA
jgi:molybdenum cofactor cytidylyltransferase